MRPDVLDPKTDMRMMLRHYLIDRGLADMNASARRRAKHLAAGTLDTYRGVIRQAVSSFYGDMIDTLQRTPLEMQRVSTYGKAGYRLENVLFNSFPGMQVNATVYVPLDFEPPYHPVVIPVGHSGKQFINYQLPAQFFARSGFLAITFDPPGQQSEKQIGNDHFVDGVRCYPVGESSSRYFVADALRSIDYLETRSDVDMSRGVAMTGVSGGGTTTTFALHLDERIAVGGPSCCVAPLADLDIQQCYSGCPETHMWRRYADGIDEVDLVCAAVPRPMLLMAGRHDEVFRIDDTRKLAAQVGEFYAREGAEDRFEFFVDDSGHAYTLTQARRFTRFMNTWLVGEPNREISPLADDVFSMDPYEELKCHPGQSVTMRTLSAASAEALASKRSADPADIRQAALGISGLESATVDASVEVGKPFRTWTHEWQQVLIRPEEGMILPGTYLRGIEESPATILHFDDRHRDRLLYQHGPLATAARFLERDRPPVSLLTVDLRGWGDTRPTMLPYEISEWSGIDRYLAYASAALGDSIMGMRIRDGVAALSHLRDTCRTDTEKIIITGCGLGGIVALHVALLESSVAGVAVWDTLESVSSLVAEPAYSWPADAFIPNMLVDYDLPELAAAIAAPVEMVNTRGPGWLPGHGETNGDEITMAIQRLGTRASLWDSTP